MTHISEIIIVLLSKHVAICPLHSRSGGLVSFPSPSLTAPIMNVVFILLKYRRSLKGCRGFIE